MAYRQVARLGTHGLDLIDMPVLGRIHEHGLELTVHPQIADYHDLGLFGAAVTLIGTYLQWSEPPGKRGHCVGVQLLVADDQHGMAVERIENLGECSSRNRLG